MPVEISAGAVIFREENDQIYFLLLHYPGLRYSETYWGLPKGHIEAGENPHETATREIEEETGLKDIEFVPGFKETVRYFFVWEGEKILKIVTFFLAQTETSEIILSKEHLGFDWLTYNEALKRLSFKNTRSTLLKADEFLLNGNNFS